MQVHVLEDILAMDERDFANVHAYVLAKFLDMTQHHLEDLADVGVMPLSRHHTWCNKRSLDPTLPPGREIKLPDTNHQSDACSCGVEDEVIERYLAIACFLNAEWPRRNYRGPQEWVLDIDDWDWTIHLIQLARYPDVKHHDNIRLLGSQAHMDTLAELLVRLQANVCMCHLNEDAAQDQDERGEFIDYHREVIGREWAVRQYDDLTPEDPAINNDIPVLIAPLDVVDPDTLEDNRG